MDPINLGDDGDSMHLDSNQEVELEDQSTSRTTDFNKKKRKLTSSVWEHFTKETRNGQLKAVCNYCRRVLGGKPQNSIVRSELDLYLEQPILPRTSDFDILSYWKSAGNKYPVLKSIARDILAIPVSTVASESVFSTGGRYLGPHRSRLHPRTLEALIFSQNWLSNERNGKLVTLSHEDIDIMDEMEPYAIELDV